MKTLLEKQRQHRVRDRRALYLLMQAQNRLVMFLPATEGSQLTEEQREQMCRAINGDLRDFLREVRTFMEANADLLSEGIEHHLKDAGKDGPLMRSVDWEILNGTAYIQQTNWNGFFVP